MSFSSFTSRIFSTAFSGVQNTGCCSTSSALGRSSGLGWSMSLSTTRAAATTCRGSLDVSSARSENVPRMIRWFSYRPAIPEASGECLSLSGPEPELAPELALVFSSSRNGLAAPVNAAYIKFPKLHTSTAAVRFWLSSTSGGRPCNCTFTP